MGQLVAGLANLLPLLAFLALPAAHQQLSQTDTVEVMSLWSFRGFKKKSFFSYARWEGTAPGQRRVVAR